MNKLIKTLIIINGTIIPIVLLFMFALLAKEVINSNSNVNPNVGINVENKKLTESGDTIVFQGISYSAPFQIYNSTNYCIGIEAKTYEEPEIVYSKNSKIKNYPPPPVRSSNNCRLNYIFLDKNFNYIGKLVNKKASIVGLSISEINNEEIDSSVKVIVYLIAFSDSNKDGLLNELDHHDLYISNLSGSDLTKVTNNIEIEDCKFINQNRELFITYKENTDKKEEYKLNRFAVYNISNKQLRLLTSIDQNINEVLNILNKK